MCTRILTASGNKTLTTGRNMDWHERFSTDLWMFPGGMEQLSLDEPGIKNFTWTSKFKSVMACPAFSDVSGYKAGKKIITPCDGINEKGLSANILWLADSCYHQDSVPYDSDANYLSIGMWTKYMLDNYTSVEEAVKDWISKPYEIVGIYFKAPAVNQMIKCHLSLSDAEGGSAIFEYYADTDNEPPKLHITTNLQDVYSTDKVTVTAGVECAVMTNSPVYEVQRQLYDYWKWNWNVSGNTTWQNANYMQKVRTLPGTSYSTDRFARASHYLERMTIETDTQKQILQTFSLLRNTATPTGYALEENASFHTSPTLWASVADNTHLVYYFHSTDYPFPVWVDLNALFIGAPVIFSRSDKDCSIAGNITNNNTFAESDTYEFLLHGISDKA